MSDRVTQQLPTPRFAAPRRRPRGRRRLVVALITMLCLIAALVGLDRAAAAYAQNRIASQIQRYGFTSRPAVTIEGFPFLTQLISRHLADVRISSHGLRAGRITASIEANATGITLNSGYNGGVIAHVTGTGLIPFASLATLARSAGAPALAISAAGPHSVRLRATLGVVSATAVARVKQTGPGAFRIHIVAASGVPLSLLAPIRTLTIHLPAFPLGLAVRGLRVAARGLIISVTGSNIRFGQ